MFDFSNLRIEDKTSRFDIPQLGDGAHLMVRPAGQSNKPFHAAMLKRAGNHPTKTTIGTTLQDAERDRADDRVLYPKYVVAGGALPGSNGKLVYITHENAAAAIDALPDWLFDRLRVHCMRPDNFIDAFTPTPVPADVAGK